MTTQVIPRTEWREFADGFSRSHLGWLVSLTVNQPAGQPQYLVRDVPFEGMTVDEQHGHDEVVFVMNGKEHFVHTVPWPRRIVLHRTAEGADESVNVLDCDSMETTVRFHTPAQPLLVDGVA